MGAVAFFKGNIIKALLVTTCSSAYLILRGEQAVQLQAQGCVCVCEFACVFVSNRNKDALTYLHTHTEADRATEMFEGRGGQRLQTNTLLAQSRFATVHNLLGLNR